MNRNDEDPKLPLLARGFRRRDVLAMGSVLAATPLLSRAVRAQELLAAPAGKTISFGYVAESLQMVRLDRLAGRLRTALRPVAEGAVAAPSSIVTIVPASGLPSGDPSLSNNPVRMRIGGFFPVLAKAALPVRVDLDVFVRSPEVPLGATFFAWSWRKKPENLSAPVAFNVSPDFQSEVTLILRVQGARDRAPVEQRATFTLGDDPGRPRLVRGGYLLALTGRPWDGEVTFSPELPKPGLLSLLVTAEPVAPPA